MESKVCEEKKNSDSKRKYKSGNMGTEELEMSFREQLWERKKSGKLIPVLHCHCSCFFPCFPLKFSSKNEYYLIKEYVTDMLAESFFF